MKCFKLALILSQVLVVKAKINEKYKQIGTSVDRSKQIRNPTLEHGNAIVRSFDGKDEVSFKLSRKDNARVAMASDNEDIDYSIRKPGTNSTFQKLEELEREGQPGRKVKENINGKELDGSAVKLKIEEGGEVKVKAEGSGNRPGNPGRKPRSLAESNAAVIVNPSSVLNVCYKTASLINKVGDPLTVKIALCETDTGAVHGGGGEGVLSGTAVADVADVGGDKSAVSIPASGDDGFSEITFTPNFAGMYSIVIDVEVSDDGETFERQAYGVIAVSERQLDSVQSVSLGMEGDSAHLAVKVALADGYSPSEGDSFIVSADIVDGSGNDIMTASAIADLEDDTLLVVIQPEWFEGVNAFDCSIEYLIINNAEGTVPLIITEDVDLEVTTNIFVRNRRLSEKPEDRELRMTQGVRPPQDTVAEQGNLRRKLFANAVIATHGYCSGPVWQGWLSGSNVLHFQDYSANRSHSDFARRLDEFADSQGYSYESGNGCGIIAHSQGGAAALHMYTYRWSCLDNITTGRRIQSVGTPYQGSPLAGNAAVLPQIFGIGCGTNYDLSTSGAPVWLSGIPSWARSNVYYYTTSFEDKWWRYDYCHLVTDLLLSDPDDGTTEKSRGQLPYGNNMGHKEDWCHTDGMRDTHQAHDQARNAYMMANAARRTY